ncbi:uncharacterized protein VTP21DRAFT_11631 [Calcarisporiella thermophila]|uniref:uncharacterized protein n=1 Tax=Calcarisporiella thermophila TaxID=911321 RepID=UPI0037449009
MIGSKNNSRLLTLGRMITLLEPNISPIRFVISDCPTNSTLNFYVQEFQKCGVTHLVRVCEPTYSTELVEKAGIRMVDMPFKDGGAPPFSVLRKWLALIEPQHSPPPTICVHCVAGLGRACVMVAIALIEYGMEPLESVEYIRSARRGAFNKRQIEFLDGYRRITRGLKAPVAGGIEGGKAVQAHEQPSGASALAGLVKNPFAKIFAKDRKMSLIVN